MAHDKSPVSRRSFLRSSAASAAVLTAASAARAYGANERLRVGFLGVGGRCQAHIDAVLKMQAAGVNIEAAAVCDVYSLNREKSAGKILEKGGNAPLITGDYRDVLANKDIDIVCVAT